MDKEKLKVLAQPVVDIYNQIEIELLVNIAEKLKDKKDLLEKDALAWQLQMMQNLGLLDKDNIRIVKKYSKLTNKELSNLLIGAGLEGISDTEENLKKAVKKANMGMLLNPNQILPAGEMPQIIAILQAYQSQAANILNLTNQTLLDQAKQAYIDILNKTTADVMTGMVTGNQALRSAIKQWAHHGIPALIRKDGAKLGPEGYVRMVMVSTTNNAINEADDQLFEEYGVDLIEISSHIGARPKCAPFQGKIFSLKPNHPKYPWIGTTSMGQPDGLFGINCGHRKYPFIEGVTEQTYFPYDKEENDKVYKESQEQRKIERAIRKAKTEAEMFKANGDDEGFAQANERVKANQKAMRKFIDETGRTRRYDREQIVKGFEAPKKLENPNVNKKEKPKKEPKKKKDPDPPKEFNVDELQQGDKVKVLIGKKEHEGTFETYSGNKALVDVDGKGPQLLSKEKIHDPSKPIPIVPVVKEEPDPPKKKDDKPDINPNGLKDGDKVYYDDEGEEVEGLFLEYDKYDDVILLDTDEGFVTISPDKVIKVETSKGEEKLSEEQLKQLDNIELWAKQNSKNQQFVEMFTNAVKDPEELNNFTPKQKQMFNNAITMMTPEEQRIELIKKYGKKHKIKQEQIDLLVHAVDQDEVFFLGKNDKQLLQDILMGKPPAPKVKKKKAVEKDVTADDLKTFKYIESTAADLKQHAQHIKGLTPGERGAIVTYTGSSYRDFNAYLRGMDNSVDEYDLRKIRALQDVLRNKVLPLSQDTIFRRNMANDAFPFLFGKELEGNMKDIFNGRNVKENLEILNKKLANAVTQDKGFLSTTFDNKMSSFSSRQGIEFKIHAPKGSQIGLFVDSVSQFKSEKEFLVKDGQKFKVISVEYDERRDQLIFNVAPTN